MPVRAIPARRTLAYAVVAALLLLGLRLPSAYADTVDDLWSSTGSFRTPDGWSASPVHATVLPDGRIFFVGVARPPNPDDDITTRRVSWIFDPPKPGFPIPPVTTITDVAQPAQFTGERLNADFFINDDLDCMGSVLDAEGRMVTAGGSRQLLPSSGQGLIVYGIPFIARYDGQAWNRRATMVGLGRNGSPGRWYPTVTRLPSGKILITGGWEILNFQDPARSVSVANSTIETYDPADDAQQVLSTTAQTPVTIHAQDYAHAFVLPYAGSAKDVLIFGEQGVPIYGSSTVPGSYQAYPLRRPGGDETVNYGTSTLPLPIRVDDGEWGYRNGSVLMASGTMHTRFEHQADVFDPVKASWRAGSIELTTPRHHPSTLLLPDGRVLILNGHDMHGGAGVQNAQYIDPRRDFAVATGTAGSGVVRGYHSIAVLLPDGRVLVAGGRGQDKNTTIEKPTWQMYTPRYPSGPKPGLVDSPARVAYGAGFQVSSTGPAPKEIVLVGLASMTHSIDMGQRQVQLEVTATHSNAAGANLSVVRAPANGHVAPPGHYWLFGVSAAGVPSAAKLIKIG